jgi:hypothetical protein
MANGHALRPFEVVMLSGDNERSTGASVWSVVMCRSVEGSRVRKTEK